MRTELEELRAHFGTTQSAPAGSVQQAAATHHLPPNVKLERPAVFKGEMDGDTVSSFCHKLDVFFELTGLSDGYLRASFAVTSLMDAAHVWYISMNYVLG